MIDSMHCDLLTVKRHVHEIAKMQASKCSCNRSAVTDIDTRIDTRVDQINTDIERLNARVDDLERKCNCNCNSAKSSDARVDELERNAKAIA